MAVNIAIDKLLGEFKLLKGELSRATNFLKSKNNSLVDLNYKLLEAEKQIFELNYCDDCLLRVVSHDLRNPMASIVSYVRIIERDLDTLSKKDILELNVELENAVQRILRLLENLVYYSKIRTGKISFCPTELNLQEIVDRCIEKLNLKISNKKLTIRMMTLADRFVYADRDILECLFLNILDNAIKFSKHESVIELKIGKKGDRLLINISDSGIGISVMDLDKIFIVGETRSRYGTDEEKGSGLGLPICMELVKMIGEKLWIENNATEGVTVHFTLPSKIYS